MRALLLYSQADVASANNLFEGLTREDDIEVTQHPLGTGTPQPNPLPELIGVHDAVVHVVSGRFLTSLECMRHLIALLKEDAHRTLYRQLTIPVLVADRADELDLTDTPGQLRIVDIWVEEARKLEEGLNPRDHVGTPLDQLRDDLSVTRDVAEHVLRFMRTITDNIYATHLNGTPEESLAAVVGHLRQIGLPADAELGPESAPGADVDREALGRLCDGISVASEDDPSHPEFPPFSPRFPATPTKRIDVPQLGNEILVKDESHNLTGSHKDRMAWEIVVHYKTVIEDLLEPSSSRPTIPTASIISNGSAAFAIQVMMRCYGLPDLRVLVDQQTDKGIVRKLKRAGCRVFIHDLSERELRPNDVLELTENVDGLDFTSRDLVDPNRRTYYDWLAYEILNCGAKHIFIPVGTGDLFVNVLTVLRDELTGVSRDRRLEGGARTIEDITLYGATSEDWKTRMDKLYAAYRPTLDEARQVVADVRDAGHCGPQSRIYEVDERFVPAAVSTARANKIQCDESGIAGLALLLQLHEDGALPEDEKILAVNTGWLALP